MLERVRETRPDAPGDEHSHEEERSEEDEHKGDGETVRTPKRNRRRRPRSSQSFQFLLSGIVKDVWSRYPLVGCLLRHVCGPQGARCDMYLFVEVMYVAYIGNDVNLFPKELVFG